MQPKVSKSWMAGLCKAPKAYTIYACVSVACFMWALALVLVVIGAVAAALAAALAGALAGCWLLWLLLYA